MFNLQSFSTQKSGVSDGNVANALNRIRQLLTKLLHSPETGVIYLVNNEPVNSITRGMIVSLDTDPYSCIIANAAEDQSNARGFAICIGDSVDPGEGGFFRFAGEIEVLMEPALDLGAGQLVYVSDTFAGSGTDIAPINPNYQRVIGRIKDASSYSIISPVYLHVKIIMVKCCEIGQPEEE